MLLPIDVTIMLHSPGSMFIQQIAPGSQTQGLWFNMQMLTPTLAILDVIVHQIQITYW